jgi:hypothetical protein
MPNVRPVLVVCFLAAALGGACADGPRQARNGADPTAATCAALDRMTQDAPAIARADVNDPEAFDHALDRAVNEYTTELGKLRDVAPRSLRGPIAALDAAVKRHEFAHAVQLRVALDEFAAARCRAPVRPAR